MLHLLLSTVFILSLATLNQAESFVINITYGLDELALMRDGDTYYMLTDGPRLRSSEDFHTWTDSQIVFNESQKTGWTTGKEMFVNAYEIHKINGSFLLYITIEFRPLAGCIGVALANNIHGPYISAKNPILCPNSVSEAFQPHVFSNDNQTVMFYGYANDVKQNSFGIKARYLSVDGQSSASEGYTLIPALENMEGSGFVNPRVIQNNDYYYMFYSSIGNNNNGIYVTRSLEIMGPYAETKRFITQTAGIGENLADSMLVYLHSSFVMDSNNTYKFLLATFPSIWNANFSGTITGKRLTFADNWPILLE